jgi:hypothetical protein
MKSFMIFIWVLITLFSLIFLTMSLLASGPTVSETEFLWRKISLIALFLGGLTLWGLADES